MKKFKLIAVVAFLGAMVALAAGPQVQVFKKTSDQVAVIPSLATEGIPATLPNGWQLRQVTVTAVAPFDGGGGAGAMQQQLSAVMFRAFVTNPYMKNWDAGFVVWTNAPQFDMKYISDAGLYTTDSQGVSMTMPFGYDDNNLGPGLFPTDARLSYSIQNMSLDDAGTGIAELYLRGSYSQ